MPGISKRVPLEQRRRIVGGILIEVHPTKGEATVRVTREVKQLLQLYFIYRIWTRFEVQMVHYKSKPLKSKEFT